MTLILALRHVPEFPPGTLRFSVYGWVASLVLFWIAPKTSAVMAFSANSFLLIAGWSAGGFLIVLGASTAIRTSPLAGSPLWLALSLIPMVAAYDHTDPRCQ